MDKKIIFGAVFSLVLLASAAPALATDQPPMNEAYKKARAEFQDAKKDFLQARVEFKDKKQDIRQTNAEEKGKAFLQQIITHMIQKLNNAKTWVQNRTGVSESDKNQALAQIETELTWLKDKQAKLTTMTKEEVRATAKEIREHVRVNHKKIKRMVGHVIEQRVEQALNRVNGVVLKVEAKFTELKAQGKNVSAYEARVATVKTQVADAKAKYQAAKDIYVSIEAKEDADAQFKAARSLVEQGNKILRSAADELKDVMYDMRVEFGASVVATSTIH